jgi:hypothetical protein
LASNIWYLPNAPLLSWDTTRRSVEAVFLREVVAFLGLLTLQKDFQRDVPSGA